ncbi:MAG TPA: copper transporter [Romboutsia timonensis]|uniref:Copper transporter n=1 Tax=Romboutsia timonensis TaxID=1776391 RepID=A0A921N245_9FIRM|nr:copper transporter [uncultured Romboutsia sp.]HJG97378.1 copper transporter [Romboutsia timonensis]
MHINMKYYIVSIGAIFISLGIGILVGYNLNYDQELSKQQASVISDLDSKFDSLKVTNDNLEKSLADLNEDYDKAIAFINDNVDSLVADKLIDKNIGIISTNQDNDYTSEIKDIITKANGNVSFDIVINNNIFNEQKIEELSTKLNLEMKSTKDVMVYIEKILSENNATTKLRELEDANMIKINALNENYQSYDSVVMAGGNNGKSGKDQYENIDKVLIETLKDKDKNIVGVQQSNTKFSYVDLYSNDKVTTIDNIDEGLGKLSLVMVLQDSNIAGKFGNLEGSDSIIPYKK